MTLLNDAFLVAKSIAPIIDALVGRQQRHYQWPRMEIAQHWLVLSCSLARARATRHCRSRALRARSMWPFERATALASAAASPAARCTLVDASLHAFSLSTSVRSPRASDMRRRECSVEQTTASGEHRFKLMRLAVGAHTARRQLAHGSSEAADGWGANGWPVCSIYRTVRVRRLSASTLCG